MSFFFSSQSLVLAILLLCNQCHTDKIIATRVTKSEKKKKKHNTAPTKPKNSPVIVSLCPLKQPIFQRILKISINGPNSSSDKLFLLITMEIET